MAHTTSFDVFLSFRGEDTRKNFTSHLYTALVNAGYRTFRDDPELERGENIKEKLENAIQQSRSSVIVFSEDYSSSRWCLDELVMILERKRTSDHAVLPVFYKVDPSEVRKQAKSLADVPKYHENQSSEKLNEWRAALGEVADLAGRVSENEADGDEAKFIQRIVADIQKKLPLVSHVPLIDVQKELKDKLLSVDPVLDDAEGKQLQFQTSVKPWLHKLKEVVYEAEDLLQEINTEVLRQKLEPESGCSTSHGQELISSPPSNAFDSAFIHPKVEEKVKEILGRLDDTMEEGRRGVYGMEASAGYGVSQTISLTSSLVEECVYGRDEEKETLVRLLVSDDESGDKIGVIPIVGMGGIGKTTLAQFLYNDVTVRQRFDLQAWVCVSKEFDVLRISQHIYESLTSKACKITNLALLQSKLQATVMGKRFFFVLDDIWNRNYNQLESLKRPLESGAHGSKIIVTTRNGDVASMMGTVSPQPDCLKPISEEDGWLLFEKHAFTSREVCGQSQLEEIGRQIVRKCNGLPLALKSLGGLLRSKLQSDEWESILDSEMWELPQEESDILPSLWLSYVHLPPHLKRCFSYCSIFPKNYRLQKSELVFLWKAQGFLQPKKNKTEVVQKKKKNKTEEKIGEVYFDDLISRSFFQRSTSSEHFIMHDLINDLANFVSGEFCVRWEDSELPNILRKTRHFSYMETNGDSFTELEAIREAKYLRTLLPLPKYSSYLGTFYKKKFQEVLYEVLPKLQCLRVLNLSMYNIEELPDAINNLKHLRHLDMSETTIRKLPDTICTLYNLRTLLLCKCQCLTALPGNLGRLISLSHLDITGTKIEKMPPRMGDLKDLQMLSEFVLDKYTNGHNSLELKKLQNLRGTLCISGLSKVVNGSALVGNIVRDKKFLIGLILKWDYICHKDDMVKQIEALEKLQPHLNLERLTVNGYGGQVFPGWSGYYFSSALVYLHLVDCVNCIALPPLGQLPSLSELHVCGVHEVVSIGSEFYYGDGNCVNKPFRCLRTLKFENMGGWKEWCYVGGDDNEGGVFPNLVQLHISDCPILTGRLALDSFPMLKEVDLKGTGLSSLVTSSPDSKLLSLESLLLQRCPNIVSFPDGDFPNLVRLHISDCPILTGRLALDSFPMLKEVYLKGTGLSSLVASSPDPKVLSLESLLLQRCPNIVSFPDGGLNAPNLTSLILMECVNLSSWPEQMSSLLPSLVDLQISRCRELECNPEGGFPSLLETLIMRCKMLHVESMQNLNNALRRLTSLERLVIDFDWFRFSRWPSTICYLHITGMNSETIGAKWFDPLNSLQKLEIKSCPVLRCLPDSRLPASLEILVIKYCPALRCLPDCRLPDALADLEIHECPLLHERCQREAGEDWPKIAHVPHIRLNYNYI